MYRKLRGNESNLVGLWNFDSGDAKDSSTNGYDGMLNGDAHCVEVALPTPGDLVRPAVLSGVITDEASQLLANADVRLEQVERSEIPSIGNGKTNASTNADNTSNYRMVFYPTPQPYDLSATWNEKGNWRLSIRFSPGEHRMLNLMLIQAVSISGTLLAYDNTFHTDVSVQAIRMDESTGQQRVVATTLSGESGNYRFINLKPGRYLVRYYTGNYVYYRQAIKDNAIQPSNAQSANSGEVGDILRVDEGKTLEGIDFRFAPFKKGVWRTYTYLDGLASDKVYAINSDATGSIWFGTEGGISRYDGKSFVSFTKKDGLAENWVTTIDYFVPRNNDDGALWFGTNGGGVSRYDGKRFVNFTREDGLAGNHVRAILRDRGGTLWIGTNSGISCYDGKTFINFTTQDGLAHNDVRAICQEPGGVIWIGTQNGLSCYDGKGFPTFPKEGKGGFTTFTTQDGLVHNDIKAIHCDANSVLTFGASLTVA